MHQRIGPIDCDRLRALELLPRCVPGWLRRPRGRANVAGGGHIWLVGRPAALTLAVASRRSPSDVRPARHPHRDEAAACPGSRLKACQTPDPLSGNFTCCIRELRDDLATSEKMSKDNDMPKPACCLLRASRVQNASRERCSTPWRDACPDNRTERETDSTTGPHGPRSACRVTRSRSWLGRGRSASNPRLRGRNSGIDRSSHDERQGHEKDSGSDGIVGACGRQLGEYRLQ